MKNSSTNGPNRNIRYSAANKLKAAKLYLEDGYPAQQVSEFTVPPDASPNIAAE